MFDVQQIPDQKGRTILITGANTGIGYEAAKALALKGARVLLGCRSEDKAAQAAKTIRLSRATADVHWLPLDLASLASVHKAAEYVQQNESLHTLINNAGVMFPPRMLTEDGFELQFGVNHLGHFALTGLLLPQLLEQQGSRVVSVSSLAHRGGTINFADPQAKKLYGAQTRYQMSKLANLLFTFELQKRLAQIETDCIATACHPGIADTELSRYLPPWMTMLSPLVRTVFNSPEEGALPTLQAATDPAAEGGDYYGPAGFMEMSRGSGKASVDAAARDTGVASKLWQLSEELTGISFPV